MLETWLQESSLTPYMIIKILAFSPICSVVYALGLVRLISRCYAVPQCSMHPNRCLLVPGLPIPFGFPFLLVLFLLASRYFTGHRSVHVAPLCAYRPATPAFRLRYVIGLPSSPIILVGFLVTSVVSFDMLLIIVVL